MSRILLIALMTLMASTLSAQTGMYQVWENEYSNNIGRTDKQFNAVCAGTTGALMVGKSSSQSGVAMYAAMYQPNGQLLWDVFLPTPKLSVLTKVVKDSQGDFYVVGTEIIGGLFNERQLNISKINAAGQVIWRTTYRGPLGTHVDISDLKLSGSHLYMCGEIITNIPATGEAWVAKFDLSGSLIWDKLFSPGIPVEFVKLAIDNAGAVTAVGNADFSDSFLAVQYNSSGMLNWTYPTSLTGNGDEKYLTDVAVDNMGNIYVTGTEETGFFVDDIVTIKLDNTGAEVWKRFFTNSDTNSGGTIEIGSNGIIYMIGNEEVGTVCSIHGEAYDPAGTMQWSFDFDIAENSTVVDSEIDANNNIYVAVQDDDSVGVVKISSSGAVLASKAYHEDVIETMYDISISGSDLYGVGEDFKIGTGFSLATAGLSENFLVKSQGIPLSADQPGDIANDGSNLWVASYGTNSDSATYTIRKLDIAGNLIWERSKRFKSSLPKFPHVRVDGSGNVVGLFEVNSHISGGILGIVKYDASGTELFTVLLDSAAIYTAGGLALNSTGDIFICGYIASTTRRMFLSRYNSSGVFQWTTTYGSPASSFPTTTPRDMEFTAQNKLVIAGFDKSALDDVELHLFQYSDNGMREWNIDVDVQAGNFVNYAGMHVAANGDVTVSGSSGTGTYVTARYNTGGTLLWNDKGAAPASGAIRSIAVDAVGRTYVCFSTNSHVWVRQLSSVGALLNDDQLTVNSSGSFFFPWQSTVLNGNLLILGQHLMPGGGVPFEMIVDDQLQMNYVNIDSATVARCDQMTVDPTGHPYGVYLTGDLSITDSYRGTLVRKYELGALNVSENDDDRIDMHLFPNPATENINMSLSIPQAGLYKLNVYDPLGRKVAELKERMYTKGSVVEEIELPSDLNSGSYFLEIMSSENNSVSRFQLMR